MHTFENLNTVLMRRGRGRLRQRLGDKISSRGT